jgi:hypothetical protein
MIDIGHSERTNAFLQAAISEIPRLLGALNRNASSAQYGSFDRCYWHYRTHSFSSARLQEAVLTLSYLFLEPFSGNGYIRDQRLLAWIDAALKYTATLQHADGSFDEWYPNERSLVATAFVTNALAETLLLFRRHGIPLAAEPQVLRCLRKAAKWIANKEERLVYNQSAGALCAISAVGEVLQEKCWFEIARRRAVDLIVHQTDEGWWSEYGGPDIGYLSLHLDYLAKYLERTSDSRVSESIERALSFLVKFIHPDCSAGGEYMSRNTEYVIPSGLVRLAQLGFGSARLPSAAVHRAIRLRRGVVPGNLDGRYICYILYNWIDAGLRWDYDESAVDGLASRELNIFFPKAGLRVVANRNCYFVANLNKGGSFRLYAQGKLAIDSGVELTLKRHFIAGISGVTRSTSSNASECETSYYFTAVSEPMLKPIWTVVLFLLQLTIGHFSGLQRLLKSRLRSISIQYGRKQGLEGIRRFKIDDNVLKVTDIVGAPKHAVRIGSKSAYTFVPSSKYFSATDMVETLPCVTICNEGNETVIERQFRLN